MSGFLLPTGTKRRLAKQSIPTRITTTNLTSKSTTNRQNSYKLILRGIKTQEGFKLGKGKKMWIRPRRKKRYFKTKKRRYRRYKKW